MRTAYQQGNLYIAPENFEFSIVVINTFTRKLSDAIGYKIEIPHDYEKNEFPIWAIALIIVALQILLTFFIVYLCRKHRLKKIKEEELKGLKEHDTIQMTTTNPINITDIPLNKDGLDEDHELSYKKEARKQDKT